MRRGHEDAYRLPAFFALALMVHTFAAFVIVVTYRPALDRVGLDEERQDVALVDDEAARRLVEELDAEAERKREEEGKKEAEDPKQKGQVVEIPKPIDERRPEDAKFLSEYDSSVSKETKARNRGPDVKSQPAVAARPPAPTPRPPEAPARPPGAPPVPAQKPGEAGKPSALAMRSPSQATEDGKLDPTFSPEGATTESPDGVLPRRGSPQPGQGQSGLSMGDLMPSTRQVQRAVGGGFNDYLKDIEEGDETSLNSRKWKFASFFNRVKRSVADHWHPDVAYRRRDPSGNIYGYRDRLTVVRVKLHPDGRLANLALERPCGVDFLDDEAMAAFRQAQPFPNPPKQLIDDSGLISFRFGFLFELSTGSSPRIIRYRD